MERKNKLFLYFLSPLVLALVALAGKGTSKVTSIKAVDTPWLYNSKTDMVVDNFYHDDVKRVLEGNAVDSAFSYIHVRTNGTSGVPDDAMYKYASGVEKKDAAIEFELKIDNEVNIEKINFVVRGGGTGTADAWATTTIPLDETFDADGNINSAITKGSWTTINISVPNTFSGTSYGEGKGTPEISVLGFSLFGDETNTGFVDIRKVSIDGTVFDDFSRLATEVPPGAYWAGFDGTLIKRHVTIDGGGTYAYKTGALDFDNAILSLKGDLSEISVALVDNAGVVGSFIEVGALKDRFGAALVSSLASFENVDINLAQSGLAGEFAGLALKSTKEVEINNFFVSDCVTKAPETLYPGLAIDSVSFLNDFNFVAEGPYASSYSEAPVAFKDHGINFIANYSAGNGVTFDGDDMVIPALGEGESYGGLFLGMKDPEIKDYLVIQVKTEDTDLGLLRFNFAGNEIWVKDAFAGYGLKTMPGNNYPYVDADGYTWLLLKLDENAALAGKALNGEVTFYWGHSAGTIRIGGMFFADAKPVTYREEIVNDALTVIDGYSYVGYITENTRFLTLEFVAGVGGARTTTLALEQSGMASKYLKDGQLIGEDGNALEPVILAEGETTTLKIDLVASGYDMSKGEHFHSHWYAMGDVVTGALTRTLVSISSIAKTSVSMIDGPVALNPLIEVTEPGYAYLGYIHLNSVSSFGETLKLTITSNVTASNALAEVRIELGGKVLWFADNAGGSFRDANGNLFSLDLKEGENVYEINLAKSGLDPYALADSHVHVHGTQTPGLVANLTVSSIEMVREIPVIETEGIKLLDYVKPVISVFETAHSGYEVGDEVVLNVTVTDNETVLEDLDIEIKVSVGSGASYEEISVVDNKFTPAIAGTYTATLTVMDEAGNSASATIEIVVAAAPETSEPTTSEPTTSETTSEPTNPSSQTSEPDTPTSEDDGLSTGAVVGIVVGSVSVVGAGGFGVYSFLLKRKK